MAASNQVLELLTPVERALFRASSGRVLAAATPAELGRSIARTRALRDKWRDQFHGQRRSSQQAARGRGAEGNQRSQEKMELFSEMLDRFEQRLTALGGTTAAAVKAGRKAKPRPAKKVRTQGHRATRAATRAALSELSTVKPGRKRVARPARIKALAATTAAPVAKKSGGKKAVTKKPATKTIATKKVVRTAALAPAVAQAARAEPLSRGALKKLKRKTKLARPAAVATPEAVRAAAKKPKKILGREPAGQLRVATKLKAARVRFGGLDTRVRSHVKAQGKRQQGKRDARAR